MGQDLARYISFNPASPDLKYFVSAHFVLSSVMSYILLVLKCMMRVKSYLDLVLGEKNYLSGVASSRLMVT